MDHWNRLKPLEVMPKAEGASLGEAARFAFKDDFRHGGEYRGEDWRTVLGMRVECLETG